jgi:uncharacterized protein (TIGR02145 family)
MWKIDTFAQTTQVRYENADGTWGNYSTVHTQTLNYGSSYSWSTSQISGFNSSIYQPASVSSYTVTGAKTNQVSIYRNTFTCYIQSRDQNANGSYTGYTARVNTTLRYGQTCSWSSPADATYQAASYSATITGNISQSLDRNRQVYTLTINRNTTYIQSVSGAGSYRAGQTVSISATASSGNEFTSWSQTAGTTGSFGSTTSATTTFTMPTSNATIYANGKSSKFYLQNVTSATCPTTATTAYDNRDEEAYTIQKLADGKCWLLDNLRLDLSAIRSLTTANTNIAFNWTAPTDITTWSNVYDVPKINTASKDTTQSYGSGSGKIGVYYNYCAATAGTYCYAAGLGTGNATSDICPKGWRMPTGGPSGEYQALYTAYSSNATNFKNALRTPLSGNFYNGSANYQGSDGYFWSSTYYYSSGMYGLYVVSSDVYPQDINSRYYGFSVRCVLL